MQTGEWDGSILKGGIRVRKSDFDPMANLNPPRSKLKSQGKNLFIECLYLTNKRQSTLCDQFQYFRRLPSKILPKIQNS